MGFPDDILVPNPRSDGGISVTETKTISNSRVVLSHYARGREILSDGRTISSSITVSKGGLIYTEIFSPSIPEGRYFYHYEDKSLNSSVLLFNQNESGEITITYETRGDYILADQYNLIESDLAAIETILSSEGKGFKKILIGRISDSDWVEYNIGSTTIYGKVIDVADYTSDASKAIVQITQSCHGSTSNLPSNICLSITGTTNPNLTSTEILIATYDSPANGAKFLNYTVIIP